MQDKTRVEQAVLLGLPVLLGATATLYAALAGAVAVAAAAAIVAGVDRVAGMAPGMRTVWRGPLRWCPLVTVSFCVTWLVGTLAPFYVPLPSATVPFLQLAGLAPIAFVGARGTRPVGDAMVVVVAFLLLIPAAGALREGFGRGTVGGFLTPAGFTTPAAIVGTPVGAFLLAGACVLAARCLARDRAGRTTA